MRLSAIKGLIMIKWDRRRTTNIPDAQTTDLPVDYLRLVEETITKAVEKGLIEIRKIHPVSEFKAGGAIFGDEVFLALTLSHGAQNLSATTVYASADFDPNDDRVKLEDILHACFEAAGSVFDFYLDTAHSDRITDLAHHSMSALDEAPFEWTEINPAESLKIKTFVKMDKSNLLLDELTEKWLRENDPQYKAGKMEEDAEDFLNERLDAMKKAGSGQGNNGGPITH